MFGGDADTAGAAGAEGADSVSGSAAYDALCRQQLEIVLTAHPTEVNRRTVVHRHRAIDDALAALDTPGRRWHEQAELQAALQREVETLWWTDEIRREKPTPVKEARQGLDLVAVSLWPAVPAVLRQLDAELAGTPEVGRALPPDVAPVQFASWMGGDRDGNPNVTPGTTREVVRLSRLRAARLVERELLALRDDITVSEVKATPALLAAVARAEAAAPEASMALATSDHLRYQPYARLFALLAHRARATADLLARGDSGLDAVAAAVAAEAAGAAGPFASLTTADALVADLMLAHASLADVGLAAVADGRLRDLIRQVRCFGLSLLPLDIRNESVRHSEALDAVTRYLGQGSYLEWDEETRLNWLGKELAEKRPLLPRTAALSRAQGHGEGYGALGGMFDERVCDTLGTFDAIASLPPDSLGAYVISMARSASDVLAVRLLQAEAGVPASRTMRVVPLFETLSDLEAAPGVMRALWALPWYKGDILGKQ
eukprot:g7294.t1